MNNKEKIGFNIILLGIVSLITDASSEMIIPLLPFFIEKILGITVGVGLIIGFIGNLGDSLSSILKAISGFWSDKIRRKKPFVVAGYSVSATSKLFFPLCLTWENITVVRVFERTGKGVRDAPRDAIIAESAEKKKGKGFGIHRALDSLGAIIGASMAFLFVFILNPRTGEAGVLDLVKWIFIFAAILAFFALIPLIFVKDRREKTPTGYKIGIRKLPRQYFFIVLITGLFAFGNFTVLIFLFHVGRFYSGGWHYLMPILLYVFFNVIYTSLSIPIGNLADKHGKGKMLTIGYGIFGLTCMCFIFAQELILFGLCFGILGLSFAFIDGVQRAYISDSVPPEVRGTALGTFHMTIGLLALPAGILAGLLYDVNPTYTFIYGAVFALVAMLLLSIFYKRYQTYKAYSG